MHPLTVTGDTNAGNHLSQMKSSNCKKSYESTWRQNHANSSLSGIEFRKVKTNELVNFVTIKHDGILEKSSSFRIAIIVNDDDNTFALPPKQTFEEMIQAKRRQQMLLYGAGSSTTNTSALSERAARRVAAMARRQSSLNVAISTQNVRNSNESQQTPVRPRKSSKSSRNRSSKRSSTRSQVSQKSSPKAPAAKCLVKPLEPLEPSTSGVSKSAGLTPLILHTSDDPLTSEATNTKTVTSMKELARQNPTLAARAKKQIRTLLRSAAPGTSIVLANGTVIKKSRRGGARVGAGRKRNRPPQTSQPAANNSQEGERDTGEDSRGTTHQDNESTNHSFASSVAPQPLPTL